MYITFISLSVDPRAATHTLVTKNISVPVSARAATHLAAVEN